MILFLTIWGVSSFFGSVPAAIWAMLGTIFGGAGLKLIEHWLNKAKNNNEARRDLNQEIKDLVDRVNAVEAEVTFWRNRFYEEQEDNALLRTIIIQGGGTPPSKRVASPDAE